MNYKIINKTLLLAIGMSVFFVVISYLNNNYYCLRNIFLLKDFVEMMQFPAFVVGMMASGNSHQPNPIVAYIVLSITYILFFYCLIFVIKAIKQIIKGDGKSDGSIKLGNRTKKGTAVLAQ